MSSGLTCVFTPEDEGGASLATTLSLLDARGTTGSCEIPSDLFEDCAIEGCSVSLELGGSDEVLSSTIALVFYPRVVLTLMEETTTLYLDTKN